MVKRLILGAAAVSFLIASPASLRSQSTTSPTASKTPPQTTQVPELLARGLEALSARRDRDALAALEQAEGILGKASQIVSDDHVNVLHGLAVTQSRLNNLARSRTYMDRVYSARPKDRLVIVNRAKLDLGTRELAGRAAKDLDSYLSTQSAGDEEAANLLGLAIDKVVQATGGLRGIMPTLADNYVRYNAKLEAARPGMRRWGTEWLSNSEYDTVEGQRRYQQQLIDQYSRQLASAQSALHNAQSEFDRQRASAMMNSNYHGDPSRSSIDAAQARVNRATADLQSAQQQLTRPTWTVDLALVPPALQGQLPAAPPVAGTPTPRSFKDPVEVFSLIPKDVRPNTGNAWTSLGATIATKRLKEQCVGRRLNISAKYIDGQLQDSDAVLITASIDQGFTAGDLPVRRISVRCALSPTQSDKAAKLVPGALISINGEIKDIAVRPAAGYPTAVEADVVLIGGLLP